MELRKDLPIKYYIEAHRHLDGYPDQLDVLFDITSYIFKSKKRKKKWLPVDMMLPIAQFKDAFGSNGGDIFKENLKGVLTLLKSEGMLAINDSDVIITERGLEKLYTW